MTPRKLICTAPVAIRSVTVFSEKTIAKHMSELGANVLLIGLAGGVIGYVCGTAIAIGLGPNLAGVAVQPVPSWAGVAMLLAATVAIVSSYLPARRAGLIDPCLCFREV